MHLAFRKHLLLIAALLAPFAACQTHDRVVYSTHPVKNLRVPRPDEPTAETAVPGRESATLGAGGIAPVSPAPGAITR